MSSKPSRAKHLESAISICLLAAFLLIGVGIFIRQKPEPKQEKESDLSSLTPQGFKTLSETETYGLENLYEKIDGKAPFYVDSGFKKLSAQRFSSKDDDSLWFELHLYDMGNIRSAFSVFSVQRRPGAVISGILDPQYAYRTTNALYCVNGRYYIELVGSAESNELSKAMAEVRNSLRKELAVDMTTEITELRLFPPDNLVPGSVRLYLTDAFGFDGLTDIFVAQYRIDAETITAFLSKRSSLQDAKKVAESYYNFLIDNDGIARQTISKIPGGRAVDYYGTTEIIFTTGPFVGGIHEAENQESAEKLAETLIEELRKAPEQRDG